MQDAVSGGLNLLTQYGYDEVGNRITQTDANNHITSYAYDQRGRRVQRTLPLGQSESYTYDAAGNVLTRKDFNGKNTTYTYDNVNRLKTKKPDASFKAPTVTYTYSHDLPPSFAHGIILICPLGPRTVFHGNPPEKCEWFFAS